MYHTYGISLCVQLIDIHSHWYTTDILVDFVIRRSDLQFTSHYIFHIKSEHAELISFIKTLINLNANSQELTVFKLFQGVFDVGNSIVEPKNCCWHCKIYSLCYMLMYFLSNRSMFLQTWVWECKDPDKLWLVWPFPFLILGCGVKISVMQQYLTAWTQASLFFIQEAQVWLSYKHFCQLGFSHSRACYTTNWFPPIGFLAEGVTSVDLNIFFFKGTCNWLCTC